MRRVCAEHQELILWGPMPAYHSLLHLEALPLLLGWALRGFADAPPLHQDALVQVVLASLLFLLLLLHVELYNAAPYLVLLPLALPLMLLGLVLLGRHADLSQYESRCLHHRVPVAPLPLQQRQEHKDEPGEPYSARRRLQAFVARAHISRSMVRGTKARVHICVEASAGAAPDAGVAVSGMVEGKGEICHSDGSFQDASNPFNISDSSSSSSASSSSSSSSSSSASSDSAEGESDCDLGPEDVADLHTFNSDGDVKEGQEGKEGLGKREFQNHLTQRDLTHALLEFRTAAAKEQRRLVRLGEETGLGDCVEGLREDGCATDGSGLVAQAHGGALEVREGKRKASPMKVQDAVRVAAIARLRRAQAQMQEQDDSVGSPLSQSDQQARALTEAGASAAVVARARFTSPRKPRKDAGAGAGADLGSLEEEVQSTSEGPLDPLSGRRSLRQVVVTRVAASRFLRLRRQASSVSAKLTSGGRKVGASPSQSKSLRTPNSSEADFVARGVRLQSGSLPYALGSMPIFVRGRFGGAYRSVGALGSPKDRAPPQAWGTSLGAEEQASDGGEQAGKGAGANAGADTGAGAGVGAGTGGAGADRVWGKLKFAHLLARVYTSSSSAAVATKSAGEMAADEEPLQMEPAAAGAAVRDMNAPTPALSAVPLLSPGSRSSDVGNAHLENGFSSRAITPATPASTSAFVTAPALNPTASPARSARLTENPPLQIVAEAGWPILQVQSWDLSPRANQTRFSPNAKGPQPGPNS
ncbi:hypothetical protein B484DRAFT_451368 [Ochromonadaceae sp. CCMP2298]|nr:hypothetical protein B484DRAFT_451368 [Ochromonadaceae sp. CCMP2298]